MSHCLETGNRLTKEQHACHTWGFLSLQKSYDPQFHCKWHDTRKSSTQGRSDSEASLKNKPHSQGSSLSNSLLHLQNMEQKLAHNNISIWKRRVLVINNSRHMQLLSTLCSQGPVLGGLHWSFNLTYMAWVLLSLLLFSWENWGPEEWSNLLWVTQLINVEQGFGPFSYTIASYKVKRNVAVTWLHVDDAIK